MLKTAEVGTALTQESTFEKRQAALAEIKEDVEFWLSSSNVILEEIERALEELGCTYSWIVSLVEYKPHQLVIVFDHSFIQVKIPNEHAHQVQKPAKKLTPNVT